MENSKLINVHLETTYKYGGIQFLVEKTLPVGVNINNFPYFQVILCKQRLR